MSDPSTIKFNQRAFNRGVQDALTLRPLREAVSEEDVDVEISARTGKPKRRYTRRDMTAENAE
jgi:hypothetical protein